MAPNRAQPAHRRPPNPPPLTACHWNAPGDVSFVGLDNHEPGLDGVPLAATLANQALRPNVLRVNCGERASLQRFYLLAVCWTRLLGDEPSGNTVAG